MKANETHLQALLDGQKQYIVPLFQRPYSWRRTQWEALWEDILELYDSEGEGHFLGSIVTLNQPGAPEGVATYLLIDGQQRLTTLSLLLAALRDSATEEKERIHGLYLENRYVQGTDRLKVLPTQADRPAFESVISGTNSTTASPIKDAYQYFRSALGTVASRENPLTAKDLETVVMSKLEIVSITLGQEDNPHRIFESLNGRGTPLSQADLLRNYFFMRLPPSQHDELYLSQWEPMQKRLERRLDEFIRDYLVKDGLFVRSGDVYHTWKGQLDPKPSDDVRDSLKTLSRFGDYYLRLIKSATEMDIKVRRGLRRLNRWGGTTTYPFLLNLYNDIQLERLGTTGLAKILNLIESFLVRRLFANVPTNELNRLFIRLYAQLPKEQDLVEATWIALSQPGLRWPSDTDFQQGILTYPLYRDSRPEQRRLILESLEENYQHHEPVQLEALTIEHIMPQTITPEWVEELGENASRLHGDLLHTLGNLTLTGYNAPLSNNPFERKRQILSGSHLELNREIAAEKKWTAEELKARALRLADSAKAVWPGPRQR